MTAKTMALTDFLLARIAEDEADSERIGYDRHVAAFPGFQFSVDHPLRLLADCEAKRRIIGEHAPDDVDPCTSADHMGHLSPANECPVFRALAAVYADHDDYREEWRP